VAGSLALALIGVVVGTSSANIAAARAPLPHAVPSLVFDKVTVVDVVSGQLRPGQRVVIVGTQIQAIGDAGTIELPKGAQVVDAQGKYLIPGLWDMHTHSRRYTDFFYPLFIANGVTGIRDGWSEVPLDTLVLWRREILAGMRVGPPRQLLAGPALDGPRRLTPPGFTGHLSTTDSMQMRQWVDSLKAAGADYIKTYSLGRRMYFTVAAAARRAGLPFGGHLLDHAATYEQASDSGATFIDHPNSSGGFDQVCIGPNGTIGQCQRVAGQFTRNGTWFVPTLARVIREHIITLNSDTDPFFRRLTTYASAFWSGAPLQPHWLRDSSTSTGTLSSTSAGPMKSAGTYLQIMKQSGLPILAGTDAGAPVIADMPPGFALQAELAMYVAEGLTPLEALQTATINPAKALHRTDSLGTVTVGKLADLVLLDGNPLVDITNTAEIRAVVANGRYYDRAALDQLLTTAQAVAKKEPQPFGQARN
jgi:hypothetical protein